MSPIFVHQGLCGWMGVEHAQRCREGGGEPCTWVAEQREERSRVVARESMHVELREGRAFHILMKCKPIFRGRENLKEIALFCV